MHCRVSHSGHGQQDLDPTKKLDQTVSIDHF